jgi:hypothetical protein
MHSEQTSLHDVGLQHGITIHTARHDILTEANTSLCNTNVEAPPKNKATQAYRMPQFTFVQTVPETVVQDNQETDLHAPEGC